MTTNHTPGPWTIERDPEGMIILGPIAHAPGVIASEYVARPHGINGRKEANARLIAAAPEMKALLEVCLRRFEREPVGVTAHIHSIRALLARIEGESNAV